MARLSLGTLLKRARNEKKMRLEDVAKGIKLTATYIGRIEQGKEIPKPDVLRAIAKVLGLPPDELIKLAIKQKVKHYEALLKQKYGVK